MRSSKKTLAILITPVCLVLFVLPSKSQTPETWSQFRGGHSLMGVSVSNVPKDLRVLWTYEAGESIESSNCAFMTVGGWVDAAVQIGP